MSANRLRCPMSAVIVACAVASASAGKPVASTAQQSFFVSNIEYGNVLPQYHWSCKTHGGEFNPSGYCAVANNPPYIEAHAMRPPCEVEVDPMCPDHAFTGLWNHSRMTTLPYTVQDSYDRTQTPTKLDVVELESPTLKATITPQYGGRLWSLLDKRTGKDVFHNNRYVQPNNDALRQAYLQGGCEWNFGSQMGHMMQTADAVSVAKIPTDKGDVVRVYAYERISKAVWQVDMHIEEPAGGGTGTLYMHIKLTNPNDYPITGYWWTNIGVPHDRAPLPGEEKGSGGGGAASVPLPQGPVDVRILTPAKNWISDASLAAYPPWPKFIAANWMATGAYTSIESNGDWSFPSQYAFDHSYLKNWWEKCDVWLTDESVLLRHVNYNGYIERNGSSMIHAHPNNGTKAWVWGQAPNERYWQDFGGGPPTKEFNYNTELQTGVMPTQYQGFPMAAGEVREWTELIMPIPDLSTDRVGKLYSEDYHGTAIEEIEGLMATRGIGQRNSSHYDAMDTWLTGVGKITPKPGDVFASQQGWAGLEMKRRGLSSLAEGTLFAMPGQPAGGALDDETTPWVELLADGTFSTATLAKHVTSFMSEAAWMDLLEASATKHGPTWLHHLHLGIGHLEVVGTPTPSDTHFTRAESHFQASLALRETAEAHRSLAITTSANGHFDKAYEHYMSAMSKATSASDPDTAGQALLVRNLGAEVAQYLRLVAVGTSQDYDPPAALAPHLLPALAKFVSANNTQLSAAARKEDRFRMAEIAAELRYHKDYARVLALADCDESRQWPTLGFELSLIKAWYRCALVGQAAQKAGKPLKLKERHDLLRKNPVPLCLRAVGH